MRVSFQRGHRPAALRLAVASAIGAVGGLIARTRFPTLDAVLIGWDITALIYLSITWPVIWFLDAEETRRLATAEDNTRPLADATLSAAAAGSLLGVVVLLASRRTGGAQVEEVAPGIGGVLLSWALIHTMFTLRYARIFYEEEAGVYFNQHSPPAYADFAYVAFTVGMTFQVSDTAITTTRMRTTVIRHALVSYMFGAAIFAVSVNILAGLGR